MPKNLENEPDHVFCTCNWTLKRTCNWVSYTTKRQQVVNPNLSEIQPPGSWITVASYDNRYVIVLKAPISSSFAYNCRWRGG